MTRTTAQALREAEVALADAGIPEARLEAQILVARAVGCTKAQVIAGAGEALTLTAGSRLDTWIRDRADRKPLAMILGTREFYGLQFQVSRSTLIPRPETELLVDHAVGVLRGTHKPVFCDVGTGSGCIATAVAVHHQTARGWATDISSRALAVAQRNAAAHGVAGRLTLRRTNLLAGLPLNSLDLILSNPPYIPSANVPSLQPEVARWEPRAALDGGHDGLRIIRMLVSAAPRYLRKGGRLAVEVAQGQAGLVCSLVRTAGWSAVVAHYDLAGIPRMVTAVWTP